MKITLNLRCIRALCLLKLPLFVIRLLSVFVLLILLSNNQTGISTVSAGTNVWTSNGPEGGAI